MRSGGRSPAEPIWRERLRALLAWRPVQLGRQVLQTFAGAGGGLLAAGLAYGALFALVPGILLILGVAGFVLGQGPLHDAFIESVVEVIPPLRAILVPAVDELAAQAGSMTLIGALGLAWGASRFYDAFEGALARVFGGTSQRGFLVRTGLGLLSVAVLAAAFLLVTLLAGLRAFVEAAASTVTPPLAGLAGWLLDLAGPLATIAAIALVFRMVPPRRSRWRAIALPSVAVAVALALLARLFVFLAPRLIGAAAVLGTLATVFAALAWLGLAFQVVLLGAAWVDALDRELGRKERLEGDGGARPAG
jgi:membrane protein